MGDDGVVSRNARAATGENAGGRGGLRFSIAPDGQSDGVLIENLNIPGQGTFARVK